jgi:hypothetical protein
LIFSLLLVPPPGSSVNTARAAGNLPTGLQDYERWFGTEHAHVNMDGDDGATGSTAAQAFAYASNIPLLDYFILTPHVHDSHPAILALHRVHWRYDPRRLPAPPPPPSLPSPGKKSAASRAAGTELFNAADMVGTDHPNGTGTTTTITTSM